MIAAVDPRQADAVIGGRRPCPHTGQNVLVTRSGHILEGRRGSLAAINSGSMVVSAHCVGHNEQSGI
jgi:hypothetical protein